MPTIAEFTNLSQAGLEDSATRLASLLRGGDFLALKGDLGAGKSTFARALLRALGIAEDIPSPTFTLIQTYDTGHFRIDHADLYRLQKPDEIVELGLTEPDPMAIRVVEWPQKAAAYIPPHSLWITLDFTDHADRRNLRLNGSKDWAQRLDPILF